MKPGIKICDDPGSTGKMPTAIFALNMVYIVWYVFHHLTRAGKRQTSFVSCDVMPDIKEDIDIEINPDDIRIDTYRSSGAGGQHINKTSSAIRITHYPHRYRCYLSE